MLHLWDILFLNSLEIILFLKNNLYCDKSVMMNQLILLSQQNSLHCDDEISYEIISKRGTGRRKKINTTNNYFTIIGFYVIEMK